VFCVEKLREHLNLYRDAIYCCFIISLEILALPYVALGGGSRMEAGKNAI
jgi:hypothetical protein